MTRLIPRPGDYKKVRRPSSWLAVLNYEKGTLARRTYPVPFKHLAAHLSVGQTWERWVCWRPFWSGALRFCSKHSLNSQTKRRNTSQMKQATFEQPTFILLSVYFTLWILVCGTCWVNTSEHLALTKCPIPFFPQSSVHRAKTEWISSVCAYANVYIPPFVFNKPMNFWFVFSNWYEARSEFIACGEVGKLGRRRGCGTPDNKNEKGWVTRCTAARDFVFAWTGKWIVKDHSTLLRFSSTWRNC